MTIVERPDARDSSEHLLVREVRRREDITGALFAWKSDPRVTALLLHGEDVDAVWDLFRGLFVFVQAAGGCVTDELKRLLMIHRLGKWDLPKGKVEEGEAVDAGALREVREECGLKRVEPVKRLCATWHTYERKGRQHLKRTDWYLMRGTNTEKLIAQSEEGISEVRWVDAQEVKTVKADTYPSLHKVIDSWEAAMLPE